MKVQIVSIEIENKGKYKQANVVYKNLDKNTEGNTRLVSFGDGQKAFLAVAQASVGDTFDVTVKQNGNYWNWVEAVKVDGTESTSTSKPSVSPKSTYETPEERAKKQVYIIRQSSLERSIDYFNLIGNKKATESDVISLADIFTNYVVNGIPSPTVEDLDKDLP